MLNKFVMISKKHEKRAREPENPNFDECIHKWFKQIHNKKIPLSGFLIIAKTEEFALQL